MINIFIFSAYIRAFGPKYVPFEIARVGNRAFRQILGLLIMVKLPILITRRPHFQGAPSSKMFQCYSFWLKRMHCRKLAIECPRVPLSTPKTRQAPTTVAEDPEEPLRAPDNCCVFQRATKRLEDRQARLQASQRTAVYFIVSMNGVWGPETLNTVLTL